MFTVKAVRQDDKGSLKMVPLAHANSLGEAVRKAAKFTDKEKGVDIFDEYDFLVKHVKGEKK